MIKRDIWRAWGAILGGRAPALSIEVTKECPLRCPGCYAYDDAHLGGGVLLRQLADSRGDDLVNGVLAIADELRPLHISLVGGDPLVRYRELEKLVPALLERGIFVQVVTSAFRQIPPAWAGLENFQVVVSIDGLQPEHDVRRAPATYERIQRNIAGHLITVHCTITGQMMRRPGYLEEFVATWSASEAVRQIWMSIFTPQAGASLPEIPDAEARDQIVRELLDLRLSYPKLHMPEGLIEAYRRPPASPAECIFARTTRIISADLKTVVTPCQFGGTPDCSRCGCIASAGLHAIGNHRLPLGIKVSTLFEASLRVGSAVSRIRSTA